MGKVVVKEICQKHLERKAGLLPEACAETWATAVSVCLRRREASLEEVSSLLPAALPRKPHVLVMQYVKFSLDCPQQNYRSHCSHEGCCVGHVGP